MKTFTLMGMQLSYSDGVELYANELRNYKAIADAPLETLDKLYDSYGNIDTVINSIMNDCYKIIMEFVEGYVNALIDAEIYSINAETFLSDYYPRCSDESATLKAFEHIEEQYYSIGRDQREMEEYRRQRKASRGRWVGGGFGVGGAIKGAVTAGAFNAIGGLGHSAVNAIGNLGSSIAAEGQKKKLYQNPSTKDELKRGLRSDLFDIFETYLLILEEVGDFQVEYPFAQDQKQISATLKNIKDRDIGKEKELAILQDAFLRDPYNADIYEYVFSKYGDEKQELQEIADFFDMGVYVKSYKNSYLKKIYNNNAKESLEDCQNLLDQLNTAISKYGISPETAADVLKPLQDRIEELLREKRTYEGIVYDTEEDAEAAAGEKRDLLEIINHSDLQTEEGLLRAKSEFDAYNSYFYPKEKLIDQVTEPLSKKIQEREVKEIKELAAQMDVNNKDSLILVRDKVKKCGFGIPEAADLLQQLDYLIDNFDEVQRTVDGVTYDSLISANEAKQEKSLCEKTVNSIDLSDRESIQHAFEQLNHITVRHIDKQKYLDKVSAIQLEFDREHAMSNIDGLLNNKEFEYQQIMTSQQRLQCFNKILQKP